MANTIYRVTIIGTGRMGGLMEDEQPFTNQFSKPYGHFSAYQAIDQTEVVAVANRGAGRMAHFARRFGIDKTYLDYREMIQKERPDIVSVTTPSLARAEPIIFAAENGVRGIYSEKGLCASLEEADRVAEACRRNKVAFNWGAMRRHHDGYKRLRHAIARGDIGQPLFATMYQYTDLIKHHPHTLDVVQMLLGDPAPVWVEGHLIEKGEPLDPGDTRMGPRDGKTLQKRLPMPIPDYDPNGHRFVPPPGQEIADPMVGFYRVGYANGTEGLFVPRPGGFEVEVHGSEGRAYTWGNGEEFRVRRGGIRDSVVKETTIHPTGESPTVSTIRNIIRELETGERTDGNIDVTMQAVETQFGIAHSHLEGGARVALPVADRSLYIPGG
jgi:predicted dehydrogenase